MRKITLIFLISLLLLVIIPAAVQGQEEISVKIEVMSIIGEGERLKVTEYYGLINQGPQYKGEVNFPIPQEATQVEPILAPHLHFSTPPGQLIGHGLLPSGESDILFSYYLPYPYPQLTKRIDYPTQQLHLIVSPKLTVSSPQLSPPSLVEVAGGHFYLLIGSSLKPGQVIEVFLSGPKGGVPNWSTPLAVILSALAFLSPILYLRIKR